MTDDEKEKEKLYREFEARMKAKDDEIIRLGQEVNKLKLNQYCQSHLNTPNSFYNPSPLSTPSKSSEATSTNSTLASPSSTSGSPFKTSSTLSQHVFSFSSSDQQMTIKRAPQKPQSHLNSPLIHPLHRQYPGSQSKVHMDYLQDNVDYTTSNNLSGLNLESPNLKSPFSTTSASFLTNQKTLNPPTAAASKKVVLKHLYTALNVFFIMLLL